MIQIDGSSLTARMRGSDASRRLERGRDGGKGRLTMDSFRGNRRHDGGMGIR